MENNGFPFPELKEDSRNNLIKMENLQKRS